MKKSLLILLLLFLTGCQEQKAPLITTDKEEQINESIPVNEDLEGNNTSNIPSHIKAHFKQGNFFLSKGDYHNAIRKFLLTTKLKPDFIQAHYNLGVAYYDTKQTEQALEEWSKTITLDPEYSKAYLSMAYAYEQLDNNIQAVQYYDKYLQLKPDDPKVKMINQKINLLRGQVVGTGIVGRVLMAASINKETNLANKPKDIFTDNTRVIYTTAEIGEAPKNTNIRATWYYLGIKNEEIEVNTKEKIVTGPQNMVFEIHKPANKNWPTGRYEIRLYVNGKENLSMPFTILKGEDKQDAQGKTHDQIAFISLIPTLCTGYYVFNDIGLAITLGFSTIIYALLLSPDLDTKSNSYYRWGFLRIIWVPYRKFIAHRSKISHSFVLGPIFKIFYITIIAMIILSSASVLINNFDYTEVIKYLNKLIIIIRDEFPLYILVIFIGILWANAQHVIADYFFSFYKKYISRNRLLKL